MSWSNRLLFHRKPATTMQDTPALIPTADVQKIASTRHAQLYGESWWRQAFCGGRPRRMAGHAAAMDPARTRMTQY